MSHAITTALAVVGALTLTATLIVGILWYIAVRTFDVSDGFDIYDGRDDR